MRGGKGRTPTRASLTPESPQTLQPQLTPHSRLCSSLAALGSRYDGPANGGGEQLQALLRPSLPGPSWLGGVLSEGGALPGPPGSFAGPFNPLVREGRMGGEGICSQ